MTKPRVSAFLLLFTTMLSASLAQAQASRAQSEVTIRQLEQQLVDAALHNDWQFWDRVVAPEWTFIDQIGRQWDKPAALGLMKSTKASLEYARLYDVQVRFFRDDIAMATGTAIESGTGAGRKITVKFRSTDILAYRDGRWLVVASQATLMK